MSQPPEQKDFGRGRAAKGAAKELLEALRQKGLKFQSVNDAIEAGELIPDDWIDALDRHYNEYLTGTHLEWLNSTVTTLKSLGEFSIKQAAQHLDLKIATFDTRLKKLVKLGLVEKCGKMKINNYQTVLYRVKT